MKTFCKYIISGIGFILIILLGYALYTCHTLFIKNQLTIISAYITFLLAAIALFGQSYKNWISSPEITINYYLKYPYLTLFEKSLHLRIGIENTGNSTAKNCICRIENVIDLETKNNITKGFEKVLLAWVGFPYPVIERRKLDGVSSGYLINDFNWIKNNIHKGLESYADFAVIDNIDKDAGIRLETGIRWPTQFILNGNLYKHIKITIAVYCDNLKPKIKNDIILKFDDLIDWAQKKSN